MASISALNLQVSRESLSTGLVPWIVKNVDSAVDDTAKAVGLVLKPLSSAINNAMSVASNPEKIIDSGTYKKILPFLNSSLIHELAVTLKLSFASVDKGIEYFIAQNLDRLWESIKWVTTWAVDRILRGENPSTFRNYTLWVVGSAIAWTWHLITSMPKVLVKWIHFPFKWINGKLVPVVEDTANAIDTSNLSDSPIIDWWVLSSVKSIES